MEYMTIQETAHLLKVSPITIRRYIADGRLAAVRVGKGVRVRKEAVDNLPQPVRAYEAKQSRPKDKGFSMQDPLWNLVGISNSDDATDVSENKHEYLADAYARKGE